MKIMRLTILMVGYIVVSATIGCATGPKKEVGKKANCYQQLEIQIEGWGKKTIIPGRFYGSGVNDLAFAGVSSKGEGFVEIHRHENGNWNLEDRIVLGSGIKFIDVLPSRDLDYLIFYQNDSMKRIDVKSQSKPHLFNDSIQFTIIDKKEIPRLDVTKDINGDGLIDVVLPDPSGYLVYLQNTEGVFSKSIKIDSEEPYSEHTLGHLDISFPSRDASTTYGQVGITRETQPWYMDRVYNVDVNNDLLKDLVFWENGKLRIFKQLNTGDFNDQSEVLDLDIQIDSSGSYSSIFDYNEGNAFTTLLGFKRKTKRTVMVSMLDFNNDSIADILTLTLEGKSILKQKSTYSLHFGSYIGNTISFKNEADASFVSKGKGGAMLAWGYSSHQFNDFNGDGTLDVGIANVRIGLGGALRAMAAKSIAIDLDFYPLSEDGFHKLPAYSLKVRPTMNMISSKAPYFPLVLVGDLNGNQKMDIVTGQNRKEMRIYYGDEGQESFSDAYQTLLTQVPDDERATQLSDMNGDGKKDLILYHLKKAKYHKVIVLASQN